MAGNKTQIWYDLQEVNRMVSTYESVFLGCDSAECVHAGKVYPYTTPFSPSFGLVQSITTESAGVLLSRITNNGKTYLVVVNHDPFNPQTVSLEFQSTQYPVEITPPTGPDLAQPLAGKTVTRTLQAGGFIIFRM